MTFINPYVRGVATLAVAITATVFSIADAAPINYGDFTGTTVMYLDVTETANTPGDTEPMFGDGNPAAPFNPSIVGDKLDFDPSGFAATGANGLSDITDGQLNFTMMSLGRSVITQIDFSERGDYSLLGTGGAATQTIFGLGIASVVALEVDGVALPVPVPLAAASASGGDDLSLGVDVATPWSLALSYDVDAALVAAQVDFKFGATKLAIALNNTLAAISEPQSIAFIAKKDFMIDVSTDPLIPMNVPEPSTAALLVLAICGLGMADRLRSRRA